jgi:glycine/D-amino acid oxidase-like deaminating enzyme
MKSYDVVIVGGRVIGGSMAYHLAACGDFDGKVLVVEKDPSYEFASCTRSSG